MTTIPTDAEWLARARASAQIRRAERGEPQALSLLPPHASLRRYARVHFEGGSEIVMLLPPPGSIPDEVGSESGTALADEPFVIVSQWLQRADIPGPRVRAMDPGHEALWLDDLGDLNLDDALQAEPGQRQALYLQAIELLLRIQTLPPAQAPGLVTSRSFDAKLLRWELDHYVEWRLEAWLGLSLTPAQRDGLDAAFDDLVERLMAIPQTIVHRDFQSHNIMVHQGRLAILDFQDTLMGPLVYDAVALLRDSYVQLAPQELSTLLQAFAGQCVSAHPHLQLRAEDVQRWFHLQTLQRKLKDAGRFVFIDRVKKNPSFLGYIEPSLQYVSEALGALGDEVAPIRELLEALDPKVSP